MSGDKNSNRVKMLARIALALATIAAVTLFVSEAASAQSWWPFGGGNDEEEQRPPVPREPVYRQPSDVPPPPDAPPQPGVPPSPAAPPPPPQPGAASNYSTKNPICYQLEQRLVQEGQKGNASRDNLPRIEDQIRTLDRTYNTGQSQLDASCYDSFLFTKTFRDTPRCKDLQRQVEGAKARLADLEAQRQSIMGSSGRSYQDDIIRELARNNCGANYVDQARRQNNGGGMWEDEESGGGNTWSRAATNGAQTYRTICVRMCDGFYFPVSFSTLPSHFAQDADACSSKCAAPAELYYYPNPGGAVDQAVALRTQEAYTKLKVAFRYRKEYVNGCSCNAAEYVPPPGTEKKAEATPPAPITTGSTTAVNRTSLPPPAQSDAGWQTEATPDQAPAQPQ